MTSVEKTLWLSTFSYEFSRANYGRASAPELIECVRKAYHVVKAFREAICQAESGEEGIFGSVDDKYVRMLLEANSQTSDKKETGCCCSDVSREYVLPFDVAKKASDRAKKAMLEYQEIPIPEFDLPIKR